MLTIHILPRTFWRLYSMWRDQVLFYYLENLETGIIGISGKIISAVEKDQ